MTVIAVPNQCELTSGFFFGVLFLAIVASTEQWQKRWKARRGWFADAV